MTADLYLSRARLRSSRGEALSAIAPLLIPDDRKQQPGRAHRILWLLFQDIPDATRDFLWRDEGKGNYLILSKRPPLDLLGLFDLDTKKFDPALRSGDRLQFSLRANPVVASKVALDPEQRAKRIRGKKIDVVMHALYAVPKGQRAAARDRIAIEAGTKWMIAQGERAGFRVAFSADNKPKVLVDGYDQIPIERRRGRDAGFSVLDLKGEIEITDPAAFLAKLPNGFGSAKAFGNGLMLIRRA